MNNQLKTFVFSMYIGQKVMRWIYPNPPEDVDFTETITGSMIEAFSHECYLSLRSLESITDAEAIEVALLNGWVKDMLSEPSLIDRGRNSIKNISDDYHMSIHACQHLQQAGFALPVYFQGITDPVNKLIELNIIKLR